MEGVSSVKDKAVKFYNLSALLFLSYVTSFVFVLLTPSKRWKEAVERNIYVCYNISDNFQT